MIKDLLIRTSKLFRHPVVYGTFAKGYSLYNRWTNLLVRGDYFFLRKTRACLPRCLPKVLTNGDCLTEEMADRLVEAGVAEIFVTIHDPDEAGARQRLLPVLEKYPHLVYINSLKDQFLDTRAGLVEVPKREIRKKCYTEGIAITVDGDLLACCNDFLHSMQMGNIREQTIMEIWSSEKFREFRRKLRKGIPASKGCAYCFGLDIQHS